MTPDHGQYQRIPGQKFRHLLSGIDTLEVCFYLAPGERCLLDFEDLLSRREALRESRKREPAEVRVGSESFLLQPNGSSSGYPLVLANDWATVNYGQRNNPSFHVKFLSQALWRYGSRGAVERFLAWAYGAGFVQDAPEKITRADFCFDYWLAERDFDHRNFVSLSAKDATYREHGVEQTFDFGRGAVKFRMYDKCAEIEQQSGKSWFYPLWGGLREDVFRIEWQTRKAVLKRFGLRSLEGMESQAGDMLTYLSTQHDTLRIASSDSNRSRWRLHPLWEDVQRQAATYRRQGVLAEIDAVAALDERRATWGVSLYGYTKLIAAARAVESGVRRVSLDDALGELVDLVRGAHDAITWEHDVPKKAAKLRLGGA
jgi:hypothetical protein